MAGEADGDVVVPPTLQALLGARLDQLDPAERSVLERGAIEGEIFHRGAVQALAPDETQVTPRLAALVRKELIRSDRPQLPGEDAFRFRHLLHPRRGLRRAAEGDPRRPPPTLRRLAGGARDRARRARRAPRLPPRAGLPLPGRARDARRRQPGRGGEAAPDGRRPPRGPPAGLRRRRQPVRARRRTRAPGRGRPRPRDRARRRPATGRAEPTTRSGAQMPSPSVRLRRAIESASSAGSSRRPSCASTSSRRARRRSCPRSSSEALPVFQAAGDDMALYIAYSARANEAYMARADGRPAGGRTSGLRPRSAVGPPTDRILRTRAAGRFLGTTPVSELLAWLDENEPRAGRDHFLRAYRAGALAMLGRFDEARAILAEARAELAERGGRTPAREHHRL